MRKLERTMATLFPFPTATSELKLNPNVEMRSRPKGILGSLILLDLLGVVLMLMGLRQQFHQQGFLPEVLNAPYAGVMMLIAGVALTLPFFIWSIKASFGAFNKSVK